MVDARKTLYRLPKQGQIAGVCAGLAEYLDMDVTLVRIIFVVLLLATGGTIVLLYIILSIILPVDQATINTTVGEKAHKLGQDLSNNKVIGRMRNYMGIGLVIIGAWLLLGQFFPQWLSLNWDYIWPVLLIAAGLMVIAKRRD
jgi:phage shock protein C